ELMRAGAIDVIAMDCGPDRLEQALDRAMALMQARHKQTEQEKLQLLSQLAISVNHEINNPLAGLLGTAELMMRDEKNLNDKSRKDLQTILTQSQRIQEITARLKHLNHLRTVPYGSHDYMIDLAGEPDARQPAAPVHQGSDQFFAVPSLLVVDD